MLELLVAGLCVGDFACNRAFEAYYQSRPGLRETVREHKAAVKHAVGGPVFAALPALGAIAGGHSVRIRLTHIAYLDLQSKETLIVFKKEF